MLCFDGLEWILNAAEISYGIAEVFRCLKVVKVMRRFIKKRYFSILTIPVIPCNIEN